MKSNHRTAANLDSLWWRLGFGRPVGGAPRGEPRIRIHAASYGEAALLPQLARGIRTAFPEACLVSLSGQNPLEPAAWGKVVLYGPSMENFIKAKELPESVGAAVEVRDAAELAALLRHRSFRQELLDIPRSTPG